MTMMKLTKSQSAQLVRRGLLMEVFHHATLGRFDVSAIRHYLLGYRAGVHGDKPMTCRFDSVRAETGDPDPMAFLVGQREIDEARVAELTAEDLEDPIIFVACPPGSNGEGETHLLVDGIHRLVARHRRGYKDFVFYMTSLEVARALWRGAPPGVELVEVPWGEKEVRDGELRDRAPRGIVRPE